MRTIAIALVCAVLSLPAIAQVFNHYDPSDLVVRARQAIAEGDLATACVLLSRAGKLAPHDARVRLAWSDYEAAQNGLPIAAPAPSTAAPSAPAAAAKPAGPVAREPPPPWPAL